MDGESELQQLKKDVARWESAYGMLETERDSLREMNASLRSEVQDLKKKPVEKPEQEGSDRAECQAIAEDAGGEGMVENQERTHSRSPCPVCDASLGVELDHRRPEQKSKSERSLMKELRFHCLKHHPDEFLWVAVPVNGIVNGWDPPRAQTDADKENHAISDLMLHSMQLASVEYPYQDVKVEVSQWQALSVQRMAHAKAWVKLRFHKFLAKRRLLPEQNQRVREKCAEKLAEVQENLLAQQRHYFSGSTANETAARFINRYQLLFVERGRYRTLLDRDDYFSC